MASDDTDDHRVTGEGDGASDDGIEESERARPAAVEEVDGRIVDLLAWILDTETRAKIYVYLLANPGSTSEEVARGTGLYPSTVREALAELHDEERVTREKRESEGAGNNPYAYTAIQPSELVGGVVDQVQRELNTIFTLDRLIERDSSPAEFDDDVEPVTITVDDASDGRGGPRGGREGTSALEGGSETDPLEDEGETDALEGDEREGAPGLEDDPGGNADGEGGQADDDFDDDPDVDGRPGR